MQPAQDLGCGGGPLDAPRDGVQGGSETSDLTALLRKSDSFRSPRSRKLDPGNSLSAGKGSNTASIAPGPGTPAWTLANVGCGQARPWGAGGGSLRAAEPSGLGAGAPGTPRARSPHLLRLLRVARSWLLPWGGPEEHPGLLAPRGDPGAGELLVLPRDWTAAGGPSALGAASVCFLGEPGREPRTAEPSWPGRHAPSSICTVSSY